MTDYATIILPIRWVGPLAFRYEAWDRNEATKDHLATTLGNPLTKRATEPPSASNGPLDSTQ